MAELKTQYEFIRFVRIEVVGRKTKTYQCLNSRAGDLLGYVEWYSNWRQYCFVPAHGGVVFSSGCLADIQHFIQQLKEERKSP